MALFLREIVQNSFPVSIVLVEDDLIPELIEEAVKKTKDKPKPKKKKEALHLDHLEDLIVRDGREGFGSAETALKNVHDYLKGKKNTGFSISTKVDGSPALIVGRDSKNGKFFVGTKSFFNKNPKINYTDEDITANHGSQKGLSKKLKAALKHLEPVAPKVGIFGGDFLFSKEDLQDRGDGKITFQPNTLTYSVPQDSDEGLKISQAKIGFAPHTEYKDIGDGNMKGQFGNAAGKFQKSPDVYIMDSRTKGPYNYSGDHQTKFLDHLKKAKDSHKELSAINGYHLTKDHAELLLAYINSSVKDRHHLDTAGYTAFVQNRFKDKMKALKIKNQKSNIRQVMDGELSDLLASKKVLDHLFRTHSELAKAKNVLVDVLSKNTTFKHSYQGKASKPEGYVISHEGRPLKLVDRQHFSAANFEWNAKVNPEDNPMVISWGRMNPPHEGHEKVINKGADEAARTGAKHQVYVSKKSGDKDNPLDPKVKLDHLKTMFPGKNIALADKDGSTLLAQLQHLNNSGVKDLTMVVGSDRINSFQDMLHKYNGKIFNFKRIRVMSAGNRTQDGSSGTKMRDAATKDDKDSFKKDLPKSASPEQGDKLFKDVQNSLKMLVFDPPKKKPKHPSLQAVVNGYLSGAKRRKEK